MCVTWGCTSILFSFNFYREGRSKHVVWSRIPVLLLHRTATSIVLFCVGGVVSFFLEVASSFVERIICSLLFHALLIESFNIL